MTPESTAQPPASVEIDWDALKVVALEAMARAYVPYSKFPVGVAALVSDGRVISGCNVENASYGLTLCAECALVSSLHMTGGGHLVAFTCVDGKGNALMPCGRCRQLLYEHSAPGMLLQTVSGVKTIDEVLPDAFGPRTLVEFAEEAL
ncbi:cytidine deaminase [Glaciibacter psychrotolerans]|uniref:Cytidine deaminase n=1 Tax=Glaciibacter psychrotolerans TaxID=670054 RepID=A0A7Z0EF03_9MICO|nr:cytidine deaminase [Leifsonia psychrotolerans]NYJ20296.1 cytidine deaminase [Leifsonia psychrotolerans]